MSGMMWHSALKMRDIDSRKASNSDRIEPRSGVIDQRTVQTHACGGCQTCGAQGDRHTQPQSARGRRSVVPRARLLRPARLTAGALRDGAPASCRGSADGHDGATVRCVAADGVSGTGRLRGGRARRFAAEASRAEARAQADAEDPCLYRATAERAPRLAHQRSAGRSAAHLRAHHPSPQPRAGAPGQKKFVEPLRPSPCRRDATDYERLRSKALRGDPAQNSTLLPRGLAAWLSAALLMVGPRIVSASPSSHIATELPLTEMSSRGPLPAALASIILRMTKEAIDG